LWREWTWWKEASAEHIDHSQDLAQQLHPWQTSDDKIFLLYNHGTSYWEKASTADAGAHQNFQDRRCINVYDNVLLFIISTIRHHSKPSMACTSKRLLSEGRGGSWRLGKVSPRNSNTGNQSTNPGNQIKTS
jgi:hypothetical protein